MVHKELNSGSSLVLMIYTLVIYILNFPPTPNRKEKS